MTNDTIFETEYDDCRLLQMEGADVNAQTLSNRTPLHYACLWFALCVTCVLPNYSSLLLILWITFQFVINFKNNLTFQLLFQRFLNSPILLPTLLPLSGERRHVLIFCSRTELFTPSCGMIGTKQPRWVVLNMLKKLFSILYPTVLVFAIS